jgi:type II secretory pathway component GspD/PulD (secretin)
MKLIPARTGRRALLSALSLVVVVFTLSLLPARAAAQDKPTGNQPANSPQDSSTASTQQKTDSRRSETIYLTNVTSERDGYDIVTDLRNMLPNTQIFYVHSQGALSIKGSADDLESAHKLLAEIDRPRNTWRLTFSFAEMDGDRTLSTKKIVLAALGSGDKTTFKQGSKVPIVTGTTAGGSSTQSSQVQYLDLGLTIDAAVDGSPEVLRLSTKIAQTSALSERAAGSGGDPSISQTVLEGATTLVPGKPLVLGSLDLPGSTQREEISVVAEPIH